MLFVGHFRYSLKGKFEKMNKFLIYYFSFFVFFWAIGLDQLIFIPLLIIGFIHILNTKKVVKTGILSFYFLFIFLSLFSFFQISENFRYLTYFRNLMVYTAGFLIVYYYGTIISNRKYIRSNTEALFFAIFIFSCQLTLFGLLGAVAINIEFISLAGYIIPDLGSEYVKTWFNKSFIQSEALWFEEGFFRSKGLMLYPNFLGGLLIATYPLKVFFMFNLFRKNKIIAFFILSILILDLFIIVNTLSRSSWAGGAISLVILVFFLNLSNNFRFGLILVVGCIALIFAATDIQEIVTSRVFDRTHSNFSRFLNYSLIIDSLLSSPDKFLFGHGTQTDHPLLTIPLGSHSTFLGILYKFGILGFTAFTLFSVRVFLKILEVSKKIKNHSQMTFSFAVVAYALIFFFLQMVFVEVDVDVTYTIIWALFIGILILIDQSLNRKVV